MTEPDRPPSARATEPQEPVPSAPPTGTTGVPARPGFVHERQRHGLIGPFGGRQIAAGLGVIIIVVVVIVAATAPLGTTGAAMPNPHATAYVIGQGNGSLAIGQPAPDFRVQHSNGTTFQLTDLQGNPVRLADLRGKAVWVNFWASWCPPCQAETPVLREMDQTYSDRGLVIIGISVQEASTADVAAYVKTYDLRYRVAADLGGDIFHLYRVYALPTQFFINPDGILASIVQGPLDPTEAAAQIEAILPK